jgi:hypothetical protein
MDAFRRRNFGGYRTHPVYMERISNFMLTIQKPEDEQSLEEEEVAEDPYSSNSLNTPQPVSKRPGSRYVQEQEQELQRVASRAPSRTASRTVSQPASRVASRTVSRSRVAQEEQNYDEVPQSNIRSSDLRNKRTALNNRNYQHQAGKPAPPVAQRQQQNGSGYNNKRSGPNYSVKMALSSSSFMTDSL